MMRDEDLQVIKIWAVAVVFILALPIILGFAMGSAVAFFLFARTIF